MRTAAAIALLVALAAPVAADEACPQNRAIYTEKDNGYVLAFRKPEPWETPANSMAVLDLAFPNGSQLWGHIWLPNGTSHDRVEFFTDDCSLPRFDPAVDTDPTPGSSEEEREACSVWEGVIFSLADNDIGGLPWFDQVAAAETVLLPDLGPTIRYSGLVLGPGDEPHDVFTLTGCGP